MESTNQQEKEQEEQDTQEVTEKDTTVKPIRIDENYDTIDVPYGC